MTNGDYFILALCGALVLFAAFLGHVLAAVVQSLN